MTVTTPIRRSAPARRVGYATAAVINAVVLYLVEVAPGWDAVPFLSDDTPRVLGLVELSLVAGALVNLVWMFTDPPWLRAAGDLVTTVIGVVVMARVWTVFPFDFGDSGVDWAFWFRVLLVIGLVGGVIGAVAHVVQLVRAVSTRHTGARAVEEGDSRADQGAHGI